MQRRGGIRSGEFEAFFNCRVGVQDLVHATQLEHRCDLSAGACDAEVTSG